ncbi:MAG: hypothetical protein IT213_03490, partial [Cytophagales bacterium]|nr:hypothetical protein [Cytophagales bacterium]
MSLLHNTWFKRTVIAVCTVALAVGLFFLIDSKTSWFTQQGDYAAEVDSVQHVEREIILPVFMHGMVVNDLHVVEDDVKKNQRFTD